jgi:hypothetical protein
MHDLSLRLPADVVEEIAARAAEIAVAQTDGNYEPGNVRLATWSQQRANKRWKSDEAA